MKKEIKERFKHIEDQFFELDHENKKALMTLVFDKPSDIFDKNVITKKPMLSDEFTDWIKCSFDYVPHRYKGNIEIIFDDMEGYTEEELKDIFMDNVLLEAKQAYRETLSKNKVAFGLLGSGIVLIGALLLIEAFWSSEDVLQNIVAIIVEIGAWVTVWEALDIFLIENKGKRDIRKNLTKRFESIKFTERKKEKKKD